MYLVAGVDPFRRITDLEILTAYQSGFLFQNRHAYLFGYARIYGRLEYDNAALCQVSSQNPACTLYRGQIRRMVIVYRSRNCYDMEFCFPQLCLICSELHFRLADHIISNLVGRINAGLIEFDLFCV